MKGKLLETQEHNQITSTKSTFYREGNNKTHNKNPEEVRDRHGAHCVWQKSFKNLEKNP